MFWIPYMVMGALTAAAQASANEQSRKNSENQMRFQGDMSNTAHQREVADLQAAGLNPILSAGGSGASTPVGSTSTSQAPDLAGAVNAMSQVQAMKSTAELQDTQKSVNNATVGNTEADTENKKAEKALIENQQRSTAQDIQMKTHQNTILGKTLDSQIKKAKAEGDYSELNQIMGLINSGASTANQLVNPFKMVPKFDAKDYFKKGQLGK